VDKADNPEHRETGSAVSGDNRVTGSLMSGNPEYAGSNPARYRIVDATGSCSRVG